MRRSVTSALLWISATATWAGDLVVGPGFSPAELRQLTAVVADAVAFPQLGEAAALGVTGFHLVVAAGGPQVATRESWWNAAMKDRVMGGVLIAPRVLARKGLPLSLDVGAQVGTVFGYTFWGAEAAWGVLDGGVLLPSVGVGVAYGRLEGAPVGVETGEARLTISKGLAMVTPFASVGWRRERGSATLGEPLPAAVTVEEERVTGTAGVILALPPLRVVAEVRRAAATGAFVGVGVGL